MKREKVDENQLKSIIDHEIKTSMGEIGGELSHQRARAMDYYLGQPVGRLEQTNPDRSRVVITTTRDTVEWMMPQLMRLFAQADSVVEFLAVGQDDEPIAEQETQAINHIFWRQNEGFLILYTWVKDALIQKNGIIKYWVEEAAQEGFEEYDGMTMMAIQQLMATGEVEPIQQEVSETQSIDGQPLFHVKFKRKPQKKIIIENVPPEEFLISTDARSLDIQTDAPRFVGHHIESTENELKARGFTDAEIEELGRGDEYWHELGQEWTARYHLTDEKHYLFGNPPHDSLRKIRYVEGYMNIDMDGDGYAELIRIYRGGDHVSWEEVDSRPFAALTPNILSHKFFGQSVNDLVKDLQEISTSTMRNVLDNMYQVNNTRPIVNNRVDVDSLLTSRPGAPIYVDDMAPVDNAVVPFAPPPVWKDGLDVLEYMDNIRKDRTGVGDETMGLDPSTLASANTGVVLQAMEASQAKIELVARILAETGIKWLFRGIHELCRKHYDQPLRYKLRGQYIQVNPSEWRERTNLTVNVGTATGNRQQNTFALMQIAEIQQAMVSGGLMGKTILPSNIYQTGKELANNLGQWGEKFFFNPALLMDPQVQQMVEQQLPPPSEPSPEVQAIQATAQAEQMKAEVQRERTQIEADLKREELAVKEREIVGKETVEQIKNDTNQQVKAIDATVKEREQDVKLHVAEMKAVTDSAIAELKAAQEAQIAEMKAESEVFKTTMETAVKTLEIQQNTVVEQGKAVVQMQQNQEAQRVQGEDTNRRVEGVEKNVQTVAEDVRKMFDKIQDMVTAKIPQTITVERDESGQPISYTKQ